MRNHLFFYVTLFLLLIFNGEQYCYAVDIVNHNNSFVQDREQTIDSLSVKNIEVGRSVYEATSSYSAYSPIDFSLLGIRLLSDSNNLMHNVEFSASTLSRFETKALDDLMTNVTGGVYAYRLLPHGTHFSKPAFLELGYDPLALPIGFRPEDVYTYYYDDDMEMWQRLSRVRVDSVRHVVISSTTHFTDFINAVIRTPEMPELSAFVPTQMVDLPSPHPFLNLEIIADPTANRYGTAEVTYPISIP